MTEALPPDPFGLLALPTRGVLMGMDHGEKRLGIALSSYDQTLAMPLETYQFVSQQHFTRKLRGWIEDYRVQGIVLGLPLRMTGEEGDQAAIVRAFGNELADLSQLPVAYWDERHTSTEAALKLWERGISPREGKDKLDGLAAQHMLQNMLNSPRENVTPKPYGNP